MSESPARFRKKPVDVEATQWWRNGDHPDDRVGEVIDNLLVGEPYPRLEGAVVRYFRHPDYPGDQVHDRCGRTWHDHGWIDTLEGGHTVCPGDWIITGVQGERYPIKPDIFAATYEAAPEPLELSEVERVAVEHTEHMSTCHEPACVDCMKELRAVRRTIKAVEPVIAKRARADQLCELGEEGRLHLPDSTMVPDFGIVWLAADGFVVERWGCASLERVRELLAENPRPGRASRFEVQSREIWTSPWADVPEEALQHVDEPEAVTGQ